MKLLFLVLFSSFQAMAVPTEGQKIMISGPSPYAAAVGEKIARKGGNVIDVAVAVGLTLAVTTPYYAALGGGGIALLKMSDKVEAIDFRETAPAKTNETFFVNRDKEDSVQGGAAVGVPGFPAGLWALHKKYGKLPWRDLFADPIKLAESGFQVSGWWVEVTDRKKDRLIEPGRNFFIPKGVPLKPGDTLKQPALAKALRILQKNGETGFYTGAIAKDVVDTAAKTGGVLSLEDLKKYKVRWLEPMTHEFKGHKIYLAPPPSSGGVVIKTALTLIPELKIDQTTPLSVDEFHGLAEVLKRAFRGRSLLGDPDFHKNPIAFLLGDDYLKTLTKTFKMDTATIFKPLAASDVKEKPETTHYSIMDNAGHAIALTVTLNGEYGGGVVTEKFGIALNNEMNDFTVRPGEPNMFELTQGNGNLVQPGKRPLSSMSPTLVEKDGQVVMSLGAPGGPRIISGVLQGLYRTLVSGMDADQAVQFPRLHHQFLPNKIHMETDRVSPELVDGLKKRGHEISSGTVAKVYLVRKNEKGILEGAFDNRGEGAAAGF